MSTINVKFSGNAGDCITLLPAIREYYRKFGKKSVLLYRLDIKAFYYNNAKHPVIGPDGDSVMMKRKMFETLRPLLLAQEGIEDVRVFNGEEIKLDFDLLYINNVNKPLGSINRWPFYIYPNLACDLTAPWITVPELGEDLAKGKILVCRTERYRINMVHWFFLRQFEKELLYVGLESEHENFCREFGLNIGFLKTKNFLTLAQAMKQCRFFLSNQTAAYQIAEGLKIPRIVESCAEFPNVIPVGDKAYDFKDQKSLEYYFNFLYNETKDHTDNDGTGQRDGSEAYA